MSATFSDSALDRVVRADEPVRFRIQPGSKRLDPAELWRFRDLLRRLVVRDIQVRYKQTALGVLWAVLQPFGIMVVLSIVLERFLGQPQAANPVFLFAALVPWTFFASSVVASSNSLVGHASILSKTYFPRLLIPLSAAGAPLIDFAIAAGVLGGLMAWYGIHLSWRILLLPPLVLTTLMAALGVGVFIAVVTVAYRDFRYVVPFGVQVGFFLSPIMYPADGAPWVLCLNPMYGTIAGFRAAVLGTPVDYGAWLVSAASAALCLAVGLVYFARVERRFADVI